MHAIRLLVSSSVLAFCLTAPSGAQESGQGSSAASAYIQGVTGSHQPDQETLQSLNDAGFTAVIDLRGPDEDRGIDERAAVENLGMSYISLPVLGADDISYANAIELDRLLAQFDEPVFVHCGTGNRAGALLALRAKLNGAANETAVEAGRESGLGGLEDVVRQRLDER